MNIDRRHLAIAGAVALGATSLLRNTQAAAEGGDEAAVAQVVEALRKAWFDKNKAEFIDGVMGRKATVKSLTYPDLKVMMAGNNAIARHRFVSESELDGKTTNTDIGILEVWTKQDGAWKLLARQGFKLA